MKTVKFSLAAHGIDANFFYSILARCKRQAERRFATVAWAA